MNSAWKIDTNTVKLFLSKLIYDKSIFPAATVIKINLWSIHSFPGAPVTKINLG